MGGGATRAQHSQPHSEAEKRMSGFRFFPSRQLALYTVRLFLTRSLAVLIGLVLVLMTLDLLGESGKILAVPGNGDPELWKYVSLRIPQLISRFLPFSVLLGTLIAFVGLNQNSEVVAMKAAGVSAHQMLAPIVLASVVIAGLLFAFNERVVVNAARVVDAWSDNDYKPIPPETGILANVWVLHGNDLVRAARIGGSGSGFHAENVAVYELKNGELQRVINADRATPAGDLWRLDKVTIYDSTMNAVTQTPHMMGLQGLTPEQLTIAKVVPDETGFFDLANKIAAMKRAGKPTADAEAGLWHKISGPLSCVLMPLLAAIAAFGLARSGQVLIRAVTGMALGFAYFVADNFSLAMGGAGVYPPLIAAWAPFFLFLLIGESVLIQSEE
jgi:lipopolysaccharide export system permease protein